MTTANIHLSHNSNVWDISLRYYLAVDPSGSFAILWLFLLSMALIAALMVDTCHSISRWKFMELFGNSIFFISVIITFALKNLNATNVAAGYLTHFPLS